MDAQHVLRPPVAELLEEPQGIQRGHINNHEDCVAIRRQLSASPITEPDQDEDQSRQFSLHTKGKARLRPSLQLQERDVHYWSTVKYLLTRMGHQVD